MYLDGAPVVDVWAGVRDATLKLPWEHDTMAMSWSTTKGVASTVLHILADRRELEYDATRAVVLAGVRRQWQGTRHVRQVMAMEAGLYDVRHLIADPRDMLDHHAMAAALAAARPVHEPGQANAYHAFTYGWIVGEVVRRITGDTLGAFVQEQIAKPLGLDGCYIGTPGDEIGRVAARPDLKAEPRVVRGDCEGDRSDHEQARVQPEPLRRPRFCLSVGMR